MSADLPDGVDLVLLGSFSERLLTEEALVLTKMVGR